LREKEMNRIVRRDNLGRAGSIFRGRSHFVS
jgi:hypothetical protein